MLVLSQFLNKNSLSRKNCKSRSWWIRTLSFYLVVMYVWKHPDEDLSHWNQNQIDAVLKRNICFDRLYNRRSKESRDPCKGKHIVEGRGINFVYFELAREDITLVITSRNGAQLILGYNPVLLTLRTHRTVSLEHYIKTVLYPLVICFFFT